MSSKTAKRQLVNLTMELIKQGDNNLNNTSKRKLEAMPIQVLRNLYDSLAKKTPRLF
jgi:predicted transcriptional regulator